MSITQIAKESIVTGLQRLFPDSPRAQAMAEALLDERENARLQRRREIRGLVQQLSAKNTAEHSAFASTRAADLAAHEAKLRELREFEEGMERRRVEHRQRVTDFEFQIGRLLGELRASASPLIDQFVTEMRDLLGETQRSYDFISIRTLLGVDRTTWTNQQSVETRAAAIAAVIARATELSEAALTDAELAVEFEDLRASIPALAVRPTPESTLVPAGLTSPY